MAWAKSLFALVVPMSTGGTLLVQTEYLPNMILFLAEKVVVFLMGSIVVQLSAFTMFVNQR